MKARIVEPGAKPRAKSFEVSWANLCREKRQKSLFMTAALTKGGEEANKPR